MQEDFKIDKKVLNIPKEALGYELEAVMLVPEKPIAAVVTAFGIPRGAENDKTYKVERSAPYIAEQQLLVSAHSPLGMGKSGGDSSDLTLSGRVKEVVEMAKVIDDFRPDLPLALYGSSMGAHIAIRAADALWESGIKVDSLVLVSPAAYPDVSENARFGEEFRSAITGAHDMSKAAFSVFKALEKFDGRVMMVWAEHDSTDKGGPIYREMIDWYNDTYRVRKDAGLSDELLEVLGAEHGWKVGGKSTEESPEAQQLFRSFAQRMANFLSQ